MTTNDIVTELKKLGNETTRNTSVRLDPVPLISGVGIGGPHGRVIALKWRVAL